MYYSLLASWTYDGTKLNLIKAANTGDVTNYLPNGEWVLENLVVERNIKKYTCCENPYLDITYYIVIRRRPLFYIFNMILPCVVITIVALLGFLVPAESGEKVSISVTTLLSLTVFLMVSVFFRTMLVDLKTSEFFVQTSNRLLLRTCLQTAMNYL